MKYLLLLVSTVAFANTPTKAPALSPMQLKHGKAPVFDGLRSNAKVVAYLKSVVNDPDAVKVVCDSEVVESLEFGYIVPCEYFAKNVYNGTIRKAGLFTISNSDVSNVIFEIRNGDAGMAKADKVSAIYKAATATGNLAAE